MLLPLPAVLVSRLTANGDRRPHCRQDHSSEQRWYNLMQFPGPKQSHQLSFPTISAEGQEDEGEGETLQGEKMVVS